MLGLDIIDWLAIVVYLMGITAMGLQVVRQMKNSSRLFIGDRKFSKTMMMSFMFRTGTHSDHAVSMVIKIYNVGVSGIWYRFAWFSTSPERRTICGEVFTNETSGLY